MTTWCDEHLIHRGSHVRAIGEYRIKSSGHRVNLCNICVMAHGNDIEAVNGRSVSQIYATETRAYKMREIYDK